MWIDNISLQNFRSIRSASITFSPRINVIVGRNNSGKSSLLLPVLALQDGLHQLTSHDLRLGTEEAVSDLNLAYPKGVNANNLLRRIKATITKSGVRFDAISVNKQIFGTYTFPSQEPGNVIYPFISKRKVAKFNESVQAQVVERVAPDFENLYGKIDRLISAGFQPAHSFYMRACQEVLGFLVSTGNTSNGKRAVYSVENMQAIPLTAMGEGVTSALGLIVHLAISKQKIFVVEEPENDIHPKSLKALIDLIIERSSDNQFFVTTHSSIVLKRLGAVPNAKVFQVNSEFQDGMPLSTISELEQTHDARRKALDDLGYEHADDERWEGWLFLEESSAEKIIREYLIPWFTPRISGRLKTFSAGSQSQVEPKFRDFNDLFVFLHLEPIYKNRAWVVIDAGEEEAKLIKLLQDKYCPSGWNTKQFSQFDRHDFEDFYPEQFAAQMNEIRKEADKQIRREKKKTLLENLEEWIRTNEADAKSAFEKSASDVISKLKEIEIALT